MLSTEKFKTVMTSITEGGYKQALDTYKKGVTFMEHYANSANRCRCEEFTSSS